jgi:hypothetical protein
MSRRAKGIRVGDATGEMRRPVGTRLTSLTALLPVDLTTWHKSGPPSSRNEAGSGWAGGCQRVLGGSGARRCRGVLWAPDLVRRGCSQRASVREASASPMSPCVRSRKNVNKRQLPVGPP